MEMNKARYRYWESATHPRYRMAWTLAGGVQEYERRARAGRRVPIMLRVKGG